MVFYSTDVNFLYSTGSSTPGSRAVYKVDPYIDAYTSLATIDTRFKTNEYIVKIRNVALSYRKVADVVSRSGISSSGRATPTPATTSTGTTCGAPSPPVSGSGSGSGTVTSADFEGDITDVDIEIDITSSTTSSDLRSVGEEIMTEMKNRVDALSDILIARGSLDATRAASAFRNSHANFNDYMYEINTAIGSYYFKEVYKLVSENFGNPSPFPTGETSAQRKQRLEKDKVRMTAIANLRMILIPWRFEPMLQALRDACKKSLTNRMMYDTTFVPNTFIQSFANRDKMAYGSPTDAKAAEQNKDYLILRSLMYDFFVMDKKITTEDDSKVRLYMKKLLVDIFIKTCYPLVHFDLLDLLMHKNITSGNFINARMALISKCLFTYKMVEGVYISAIKTDAGATPPNINVKFNTITNDIPTNISDYINANIKGNVDLTDGTSGEQRMTNIIKDLQNLSKDVTDNSFRTNMLQKAIADNQLTMRNVSLAIEQRKGALSGREVEFWILFSILLIVIISCSLLYYFDLTNIGLMVAAGVMVIILIYKVIMMIVSYVNK